MKIKITKISTNTMRRINAGAEQGMRDMVADIKSKMLATGDIPVHYRDEGKWLSVLLGRTGLNPYTESGRLSEAWNATVETVGVDMRYKKVVLTLLNTRILNEKTRWLGLSDNPENSFKRRNHRKTDKLKSNADYTSHKYLGARGKTATSVIEDGYRPMPTTNGGFKWIRNPYPGYGYWKTYNDGFRGMGVDYAPRPFVQRAFNNILPNPNIVTSERVSHNLGLNRDMMNKLTTSIAKRIG